MNTLYYGDNLDILRRYIGDETVGLCYLDPPFNSNQNYNVLFAEKDGARAAAQIQAFNDTWRWDQAAATLYEETVEAGGKVSDCMRAFRTFLGANDMLAYLTMMAPRLVELRRVLKPTGSLYLHCDPTASHYLKLLLDAVFGPANFRNEIVWKRTSAKGLAFSRFASNHDVLLRYSKAEKWTWNPQYTDHDPDYLQKFYRFVEPETGRRYRIDNLANPNHNRPNLTYEFLGVTRVWRWTKERMQKAYDDGIIIQSKPGAVPGLIRYLDEQEGTPVGDTWADLPPIQSHSGEHLGYPTQKPVALLERIIQASSNEGDLVLDPFCGCGTTIAAAQSLGRQWIGIDITHLAIGLIRSRLQDTFQGAAQFQVIGEPTTLPDAQDLAETQPYQFQWWALGLVGARPVEQKKGADRGIDGRLFFHDEQNGKSKQIILSVKAGGVTVSHLRDLRGVLEREKAEIGVLISMQPPTEPMRREAADGGYYTAPFTGEKHPRLQLLTIAELLEGKSISYPAHAANVTVRRAPRARGRSEKQLQLGQ
jgi:DNA modification methylase